MLNYHSVSGSGIDKTIIA